MSITIRRLAPAVVGLAALGLVAGCGSAAHAPGSAASSDYTPGLGMTSSPATSPTAVDYSAAMSTWDSDGGGSALDGLSAALTKFTNQVSDDPSNFAGDLSACQRVEHAVLTMRQAGPMPVPVAERWFRPALGHMFNAAIDCITGTEDVSPPEINDGTVQMDKGDVDLGKAVKALHKIGA